MSYNRTGDPLSAGYRPLDDTTNNYRGLADPVVTNSPRASDAEVLAATGSVRNLGDPLGSGSSLRAVNQTGTARMTSPRMERMENGSSMRLADTGSSVRLNIPTNQFELDAADGLTSSTFDLRDTIHGLDTREGLKDDDKVEVHALMSEGHDFDSVCRLARRLCF